MELAHTLPPYLRFRATMNTVKKETMTTVALSAETLEYVESLEEDNYSFDDMMDFINEHGESDFVKFYESYVELGEKLDYESVDAYVKAFGLDCLEGFEDAYFGSFDTEEEFVKNYLEMTGVEVPDYVVVDWSATWDNNFKYDFVFQDGYVFHNC
jgi:hypothetical protein